MSSIKIKKDNDIYSEKEWEDLHIDLKDPSLWKEAKKDLQSEFEDVKKTLIKKRGRPKNEEQSQGIYIKLPESLISDIKEEAKEHHIGYQALIKMILSKHAKEEKKKKSA